MRAHPVDRPADLDVVRESYDRVADNYAHMVVTTGVGDIRRHPWLKASIDAFADTVDGLGPVLDVGCGPGTVTVYLAERGLDVSGVDLGEASLGGVLGQAGLHPVAELRLPAQEHSGPGLVVMADAPTDDQFVTAAPCRSHRGPHQHHAAHE
ncbi:MULTISPECIES: class I SAM-dependent methyltransferase [Streptomyces]|uniref:methyltransferase domain-containing protein n=1 Tax=Streptomyces niveus TaxID=193462 RepID=UPI000ADE8796|nr:MULTISPECIES: class I SAM-dependent methyltransferase [Streptomyces]